MGNCIETGKTISDKLQRPCRSNYFQSGTYISAYIECKNEKPQKFSSNKNEWWMKMYSNETDDKFKGMHFVVLP